MGDVKVNPVIRKGHTVKAELMKNNIKHESVKNPCVRNNLKIIQNRV